MNILIGIGAYMLASSLIMVGYVWIKYITVPQTGYEQTSEIDGFSGESQPKEESIAA